MSQKKVVSIEDRIPKLKQARKKKANRRLIFYISVFFVLISIVVYLQSSLSHVHHVEVSGNKYITEKDIKSLSEVSNDDNFWSVNKKQIEERIAEHPEIKSVQVSKIFPTTVTINIEELERVGYVKQEDTYFPLLENGERLESYPLKSIKGDAPLLVNFTKQTYLQEIAEELQTLPEIIVDMISEIYWQPTEGNPYKIWMYMNDGYEVEGSLRNFSKSMRTYPSITSQLEAGSKGIIHIGVGGAVFDPYDKGATVDEEDKDEIEG